MPCCGLATTSFVLKSLLIDHDIYLMMDLDSSLRDYLMRHFNGSTQIFLGRPAGDITKINVDSLPAVDLLACGPSCPPWPLPEDRNVQQNAQADELKSILAWLPALARKGLKIFWLENVVGICKRSKGQDKSFVNTVLESLHKNMPSFHIKLHCLALENYDLPCIRNRIIIMGTHRNLANENGPPSPLRCFEKPPELKTKLLHLLNLDLPNLCHSFLSTDKKRENLEYYEKILAENYIDNGKLQVEEVSCAVMDLSRTPANKFGAWMWIDRCPALNCSNKELFVTSLIDLKSPGLVRKVHRYITSEERFVLQGLYPYMARHFNQSAALRVTGNASPVPLMAAAMVPALCSLAASGMVTKALPGEEPPVALDDCVMAEFPEEQEVQQTQIEGWLKYGEGDSSIDMDDDSSPPLKRRYGTSWRPTQPRQ